MTTAATAVELNVGIPTSSRVYDVWLGGKDNFAADRACAAALSAAVPALPYSARENRNFLLRAVRHLVAGCGIRQILDVGCGLPAGANVHEAAQKIDPTCRVVYVDNDHLVASHARALMTSSTPQGQATFVLGDLLDPVTLLAEKKLRGTLDLSQPVALLLVGILPYCDQNATVPAVKTLTAALSSGSYLAVTHLAADPLDPPTRKLVTRVRHQSGLHAFETLPIADIGSLLDGLTLVEPGLVPAPAWRPETARTRDPSRIDELTYAGVAKVP